MSDKPFKLCGPYHLSAKVFVTNGESEGSVTFDFDAGVLVSQEDIDRACDECLKDVRRQMGDGFRLMNKQEMFNALMRELTDTDERVVLPGGDEWDAFEG